MKILPEPLKSLSTNAKSIYLYMLGCGEVNTKVSEIAQNFGVSNNTVRRILKKLNETNYFSAIIRDQGHANRSNRTIRAIPKHCNIYKVWREFEPLPKEIRNLSELEKLFFLWLCHQNGEVEFSGREIADLLGIEYARLFNVIKSLDQLKMIDVRYGKGTITSQYRLAKKYQYFSEWSDYA